MPACEIDSSLGDEFAILESTVPISDPEKLPGTTQMAPPPAPARRRMAYRTGYTLAQEAARAAATQQPSGASSDRATPPAQPEALDGPSSPGVRPDVPADATRGSPEYDKCGTFGCILRDRHPGLHVFGRLPGRQVADGAEAAAATAAAQRRKPVSKKGSKKPKRSDAAPAKEEDLSANAEPALRAGWTAGARLECYCVRIRQWTGAKALDARGEGTSRELLVHYMGWNSRWDEWVCLRSGRLRAPETTPGLG